MLLLILGVAVWSAAHLLKRLAPEMRADLGEAKGRGIIAIVLFASVALMVIGYRMAYGPYFWGRTAPTTGINNLLMILSVYLFASSGTQNALGRRMRHPMLAGVKVWALAHILVNGDLPSFILFGGLFVWALVEMIVINKSGPRPAPAADAPTGAGPEIKSIVGTVVVYGVIAYIHVLLGYFPFG